MRRRRRQAKRRLCFPQHQWRWLFCFGQRAERTKACHRKRSCNPGRADPPNCFPNKPPSRSQQWHMNGPPRDPKLWHVQTNSCQRSCCIVDPLRDFVWERSRLAHGCWPPSMKRFHRSKSRTNGRLQSQVLLGHYQIQNLSRGTKAPRCLNPTKMRRLVAGWLNPNNSHHFRMN